MKSATAPKFFGRRRAEQAAYNERSAEADLVEKLGGRNLSRDPIRSIRKVNDARRYVAEQQSIFVRAGERFETS